MRRILQAGGTALVMAWSMACGDVTINGPDWPKWPPKDNPAGQVRVPFDWQGQVAPGRQIEIKGISGDIRAIAASGSDVVVKATKIGQPADVAAVSIDVVPHALGVTLCAVYPDVAGLPPNSCEPGLGGNMSVRDNGHGVDVEFTVEVPDGVTFVGRNVTGDVVATGLRSDAFVSTTFGDARVSTTRLATARTVWGSVIASIGLPDWGQDLEFTTTTGDVTVTIPAATNARVQAAAPSGSITSDFPLTQATPGDMRGTIGGGGPALKLATLKGDIALRRGG
ncbi:MAG: hypothetical protein OEO20_11115 [Gemmatimonadota bacterium]|nr:hypothetical protein [Gemmatimonadota bacterium]MDH3478843.1 hypothetical protein [Gemmatimonadota bacterium]MDH3569470.1 hypothetical protein [Gemmatimonadota bacterium]MDH5549708.1 hypothetical protein [Gemmatimonadota bacterium]